MDPKLFFFALLILVEIRGAPVSFVQEEESKLKLQEFEKHLEDYLHWYYETHIRPKNPSQKDDDNRFDDMYDVMQSDQPVEDASQQHHEIDQLSSLLMNLSSMMNLTKPAEESSNYLGDDFYKKTRDRRNSEVEVRDRDNWTQLIKDKILLQTGRTNGSMSKTQDQHNLASNISNIWQNLNDSFASEDFIAEKIRSYYPSCEIPKNTDQEMWKDENTMNLYFNIEQNENNGNNIAAASLRLYRLFQENSTSTENSDCDSGEEEEKLLRVTIYWYTKSLKKHRVKRRISDSKVVGHSAKWVELSVKSATKAWTSGKNSGLAIILEDQDGTLLKADRYFKGPSCTVGTSTPKPIPSILVDRLADELSRGDGASGGNPAGAVHHRLPLYPTIDVCMRDFAVNGTEYRGRGCSSERSHDHLQAALRSGLAPSNRHIRHQRQHLQETMDPRHLMENQQVVLTRQQLMNYQIGQQLQRNATKR